MPILVSIYVDIKRISSYLRLHKLSVILLIIIISFKRDTFNVMTFTSAFFIEFSGWIPALIFPTATSIQLIKILREKTAEGVSILSWSLFGFANIGLYFYAEKYLSIQSILGQLGTAFLDFVIVGLALSLNSKKSDVLLKTS